MKRYALVALLMLRVCAAGVVTGAPTTATTQDSEDVRTFELTPVAPPTPVLKYSFQYPYVERIPGNAAPLYLDAVLLMKPGTQDKANKAIDAYFDGDFKTFEQFAEDLDVPAVWMEIDQAGRRMDCDYNAPFREMAANTLLPHLQFLAHGLERSLEIRALHQIRLGKIDDAIITLRQAYVLADNINESVLVSALVSAGCTQLTHKVLAELMSRPDAPNLYWAIRELPPRREALRRAWDCETSWIYFQSAGLKRFATGAPLSAPEWRRVLIDDMLPLYTIVDNYDFKGAKVTSHPDPIKDASPEALQKARSAYAQAHKLSPEDAAKVDSAIVLGEYYVHEVQIAIDRQARLRVLPYPELLARLPQADAEAAEFKKANQANPLSLFVSTFSKAVWNFARTDRRTAALAAVEAIRSYAAEHGGALPKSLHDVKETPVPENPATGKPFEYRVENGIATLSDTESEWSLMYTIKLRK
jgi:tetratricopeptide (TPR) repeat protein